MNIKISPGNSKMGKIPSISLPSVLTCRADAPCYKKCYARKIERLRKSVRDAYQHNYDVLTTDKDTYWREVEASIMMSRFFRFHVSGDIPDMSYLIRMINVAIKNSHCNILCFTKKYELVNCAVENGIYIPDNMHIVFSAWENLEMNNKFNFPEAHVRYKDGSTTASIDAKTCGGNCAECAVTDGGCWNLKHGEQVVFDEH